MPLTNALLLRWADGYTWTTDSGSITTYSRREGYLAVAASSKDEALRIAAAVLADTKDPAVAVTAVLEPTGTGDNPYADFAVGDYITAPDPAGAATSQRVMGLAVSEDGNGDNIIVPELTSLREIQEQAVQRWLKRMANGTLGGTSASSTPPRVTPPTLAKPPTEPITFSMPGAVVLDTSGRYYPTTSVKALYFKVSLKTTGTTTTTVVLKKNGTTVATVSLASGVQENSVAVSTTWTPDDYATVQTTAAGTGALGLTAQVSTV